MLAKSLASGSALFLSAVISCSAPYGAGGLGLMAGIALGARRSDRSITVVGVETDQCRAVSSAVAAGRVVQVPIGETIAEVMMA